MCQTTPKQETRPISAKVALPTGVEHADQLDNTLRLVVIIAMQLSFLTLQKYVSSFSLLLTWLVAAIQGVYVGIGCTALAHEASHRLYFRNRFLNDLAGCLSHAWILIPHWGFTKYHLSHHQHTHVESKDVKDVWSNYPFWFVVTISAQLAPATWYANFLKNLVNSPPRFLADSLSLVASYYYYIHLLPAIGLPVQTCALPFHLLQIPINILRGITDHYGQPDARETKMEGPGRIILYRDHEYPWRFLAWIGCHGTYHALHHKWPRVPHAHYKRLFQQHKHLNWDIDSGFISVLWKVRNEKGAYGRQT